MTDKFSVLESELGEFGIVLDDKKKQLLYDYYELLTEKNKVMNLTAITDFDEVVVKHYLDSLSVCRAICMKDAGNMIDVGTGAGFPGIPIKIVFPWIDVLLLDSLNKRVSFLNEVIEKLGLSGIRAVHARAEEAGKDKRYREKFDLCTSRAVSRLCTLSEYCIPFIKKDGFFISWKSEKSEEEIKEAEDSVRILGGEMIDNLSYSYKCREEIYHRSLLVIKKIKSTPGKYPRKAGIPQKEPL